ncbi:MAG: 4-aminobutyrate--2-oxoglutarate transaminase [Acidobacteriota bacterium]|nr:MAG: 4-aminobutyrate--2-oxoglutarate transaminase [Acidobacteriota bacterium]
MGVIKLKTELPGPRSRALMEENNKQVARGVFHFTPIFMAKAHGVMIEDVDGNQLLDFASGIAVLNVGHTPERVVRAVQEQAARFLHPCFMVTPYEGYVRVAERLGALTPGSFPKQTMLANSGAEAVENAVKVARTATGRPAIICFEHAFHGRTYMAMTLTAKVKPYKHGFAPFCPEVYRAPYPYVYRWPQTGEDGGDPDLVAEECFRQFEDMVNNDISPDQVAGVIIEPVAGEGGFIPAPAKFLQKLQAFCREHGIVFIVDEIQTGFGRTGTFFACEQLGVEPDIITSAKGLGGGMPLSAVTGRTELMDTVEPAALGGTYGGNPLACASALEVLNMFEDGSLLKRSKELGKILQKRLRAWKKSFPGIGDVRGMGPMQAVEFVKSRAGKEPDREAAGRLVRHGYEHGVVVLPAGTYGNVIRFLIPLVMEPEQLEEGLNVLEDGLRQA